jgi:type II restriction enzyme
MEAIDFVCPRCDETFQLKSQGRKLGRRIVDAAYESMMRAIRRDKTPNLLALHYDADDWRVVNLLLIPRFVFSPAAIEKRPPLGPQARRAGWAATSCSTPCPPKRASLWCWLETPLPHLKCASSTRRSHRCRGLT